MKWVLIVWVFTGDNPGIKTTDFVSEERCKFASEWINKEGQDGKWTMKYKPKAKCFEI